LSETIYVIYAQQRGLLTIIDRCRTFDQALHLRQKHQRSHGSDWTVYFRKETQEKETPNG